MSKISKIILYFFCSVLGLIVCIMIFLSAYYSILEKKQIKLETDLLSRSGSMDLIPTKTFSEPSGSKILNLIPVPQKVQFLEGSFVFPSTLVYYAADSIKTEVTEYLKIIPGIKTSFSGGSGSILFRLNRKLPVQGYMLDIRPGKVTIEYSNKQGLYYALVSLKVLKQNYAGTIPCVSIEDYPDLSVRGLMLDISRDKVPSLETLKGIAQILADLKFNHLELYIEGFSFAYPSFTHLWEEKETPITGKEIQELDVFCTAHFIDLVPNQNLFGHMMSWLATDEFKNLAECPEGYKALGLMSMKGTLDPNDPRSLALVSEMTDDLLPNFTSSKYNVNLDEPLELGLGKSKEIVKRKGEGEVYLDYILKIHTMVRERKKEMLMWGDIVMKHPELITRLPKDITLLDWGYEFGYPFERHCKTLYEARMKYMVCPGTNSWASISGRTENMIATIESAAVNGTKYGASGMLLTDWGDLGHWQYLPVSYAGYTTGGGLSWNSGSGSMMPLELFLSSYIFRDENSKMGKIAMDLGRYSRYEEVPLINMTTTFMSLQLGLRDKLLVNEIFKKINSGVATVMQKSAPEMFSTFQERYNIRHSFDYGELIHFLKEQEILLQGVKNGTSDFLLIHDEYQNTIRLLRLGTELQYYTRNKENISAEEERSQLQAMNDIGKKYLDENRRLWMARNKPGGYEHSIASLNTLRNQIDTRLVLLNKPWIARTLNRLMSKVGTAAAVLYLKSPLK